MERTIICLRCPRGCELRARVEGGKLAAVEGYTCALGKEYAEREVADPRRSFSSTVRIRGAALPLLPVWTPDPVPLGLLLDLARAVRDLVVEAPVGEGDVVLDDALGKGIRVVAARAMGRAERAD